MNGDSEENEEGVGGGGPDSHRSMTFSSLPAAALPRAKACPAGTACESASPADIAAKRALTTSPPDLLPEATATPPPYHRESE